ncbi:Nuclease S1, partial [Sesbania bispinosa]
VWDDNDNIIKTEEERFYDFNIDDFTNAIQENITAATFCDNLKSLSKSDVYFKFSDTVRSSKRMGNLQF